MQVQVVNIHLFGNKMRYMVGDLINILILGWISRMIINLRSWIFLGRRFRRGCSCVGFRVGIRIRLRYGMGYFLGF